MLFEWFLRHFWQFTAKQGLLDEQDIILLEESFFDGGACCIWTAIELAALSIPSIAFLVNYGFLLNTFLFASILVLIPCFLFYIIPNVVCWFLASKVDERFRDFLACLRQKELCVFSLQRFSHCSISNGFLLPLRRSRLNCLKQLRAFIKYFNLASKQLIITREDGENLLFNFISEEMSTLAVNEKYDERTEEDESKLQTSALKTLWQCMFLVRSEFLRLSLLALHHDILHVNPIAFIRHFFLISRTLLATALLNVSTNSWEPGKVKKLLHSTSGGAQNKITRIKICRAQLEWAMERVELLEEKSTKKSKEEEMLIISAIVECLRQIIRMMENEKDGGKTKSPTENCETIQQFLGKRINDEENADLDSERMEEENSVDFQIFEADLAKQNTKAKTNFDEEMEISSPISSLFSPFGVHNALQNELKQALCLRKDFCLQREMAALAQLRGISPGEIAKEELDRTPFSSDILERPMKMEIPSSPQINHGPFGRASMNSADLNSILAKRREIFGANETMLQHNRRVMEEFADNDSEDEERNNELKNNR